MAYIITPDGRVQPIEAEVKEDGSVRPRYYHDFVSNNGPSENQIRTFHKPSEYNQSLSSKSNTPTVQSSKQARKKLFKEYHIKVDGIISNSNLSQTASNFVRGKTSSMIKVDFTNSLKNKITKKGLTEESNIIIEVLKDINELISEYFRQYPHIFCPLLDDFDNIVKKDVRKSPSIKITNILSKKQALEEYHDKINAILRRSTLSISAVGFVRSITFNMIKIAISKSLIKTIQKKKLTRESAYVIMKIKEINELMDRYYRKYPHYFYSNSLQENFSTQVPNNSPSSTNNKSTKKSSTSPSTNKVSPTNKTVTHTTERPLKSNEWVSGNYIRKGPAPKYGYARDYFGRVQERDSYREDREVNPYSTYSSYDPEDDNSSMDILD